MLDLTEVKGGEITPVPAGTYQVQLDTAEVKQSKSGGEYINAKFKITDGEQKGKVIFHMFNIKNDNAKAVEIGMQQLKTFMKCAGFSDYKLPSVKDLEGHKATATVKIRQDQNYGDKAVISYFKPFVVDAAAKESSPF